MFELSRRKLLQATGGVGIAAALASLPVATVPAHAAGRDTILANFTEIFAGTAEVNAHPSVLSKVDAIQRDSANLFRRLRPPADWDRFDGVIDDIRLGVEHWPTAASASNSLANTYSALTRIVLATVTPGAASYGDTAIQDAVIAALRWLLANHYDLEGNIYEGTGDVYGDWFNWEIGVPTHLTKALVFMRDRIPTVDPSLIGDYVRVIDSHQDFEPRFHTGANRGDMTINHFVLGALIGDDARIAEGIQWHLTVADYIDPVNPVDGITNGFYEDGSFIHHDSVAYTGSYGKNLLVRVIEATKILDGSGYVADGQLAGVVLSWLVDSFAPVMYEGWMLEVVKGRISARLDVDYVDTVIVAEAFSDMSRYARGDEQQKVRSFVKYLGTATEAVIDTNDFASPGSSVLYHGILGDADVVATNPYMPTGHRSFNTMERNIHVRDGWAFSLARSSERISKYETMSGANPRPWLQGEGGYFIHLAGQKQNETYSGEHIHTVDWRKWAGATAPDEERLTIEELYGQRWYDNPELGFTSSSPLQNQYFYYPLGLNEHSGGAAIDGYGTAGMVLSSDVTWRDVQAGLLPDDVVAYQNPDGNKSWFMLDDQVVVLAAGLRDPQGRPLTTTIDSRTSEVGSNPVFEWGTRSGEASSGETARTDLAWVRWSDPSIGAAVGYVLLSDPGLEVGLKSANVTGVVGNPRVTQTVSSIYYSHPGTQETALAYALVPNASVAALKDHTRRNIEVLDNDTVVQALKDHDAGVRMANFFAAGSSAFLESDGAAAVVLRSSSDGTSRLAVSEPTFKRGQLVLKLNRPLLTFNQSDAGVATEQGDTASVLRVDTLNVWGRIFEVEFIDPLGILESAEAVLEAAVASGAVSGSLSVRVMTSIAALGGHLRAGRRHQSRKFVEHFLEHLGRVNRNDHVDPGTRAELEQLMSDLDYSIS
ncbi:polysaccharide lyase family 8 super-sandwich domain-containing protein [Tessaracoccus rhinocerotis]|nr:polysaccharide lyase family 8 super-sandwich domain-containing protein [Tessaracoccus rhinocerotis]